MGLCMIAFIDIVIAMVNRFNYLEFTTEAESRGLKPLDWRRYVTLVESLGIGFEHNMEYTPEQAYQYGVGNIDRITAEREVGRAVECNTCGGGILR